MKIQLLKNLKSYIFVCMLLALSFNAFAQSIQTVKTLNWKGAYVTGTDGYDGDVNGAFDGLKTTGGVKWGSFYLPAIATVNFPQATVLTQYELTSIGWLEGATSRSPKTWTLQASNDGATWTILDTQTDYVGFTQIYQSVLFSFTNSTAYSNYRLVFTAIRSGNIFGLAEIDFPEYSGSTSTPFYPKKPIVRITDTEMFLNRVIVRANSHSIVLNAAVYTNKSVSPISEGGAVYSTTPNPTVETGTKATVAISSEVYTVTISGLTSVTNYYVRPFATNANGTTYGDEYVITTANAEGDVFETSAPAKVTSVRAELPVNIINFPGLIVAERGVVWSQLPNPTTLSTGVYVDAAATVGSFTGMLSGLTPNTLYYARPYVLTSTGFIYGAQQAFYSGIVEKYDWRDGAVVESDMSVESWRWQNVLQKAFNNNTANQWTYKGTNAYLQFSFTSPQVLSQYVFTPNAGTISRAPKDWTLVASNDKQNWVTLDTRTDITDWTGTTTKTFDFNNTTVYNYYRINFTAPQSGDIVRVATFNFPQFPNSITAVNNVPHDNKMIVYADVNSVVVRNNDKRFASVNVFAVSGVRIANVQGNDAELRINNLAKGVYLVQVSVNGTSVNTKVVVK